MTEIKFADVFEAPAWPPLVDVLAPDGTVTIWASRGGKRAWYAVVAELDSETVHVAWSRPRGQPASYSCAEHGTSHRRDNCPHILAATRAVEVYERSQR